MHSLYLCRHTQVLGSDANFLLLCDSITSSVGGFHRIPCANIRNAVICPGTIEREREVERENICGLFTFTMYKDCLISSLLSESTWLRRQSILSLSLNVFLYYMSIFLSQSLLNILPYSALTLKHVQFWVVTIWVGFFASSQRVPLVSFRTSAPCENSFVS